MNIIFCDCDCVDAFCLRPPLNLFFYITFALGVTHCVLSGFASFYHKDKDLEDVKPLLWASFGVGFATFIMVGVFCFLNPSKFGSLVIAFGISTLMPFHFTYSNLTYREVRPTICMSWGLSVTALFVLFFIWRACTDKSFCADELVVDNKVTEKIRLNPRPNRQG